MRIPLTGAGGFIGGLLLARLHENGHETRVLSRHPTPALRMKRASKSSPPSLVN